MNLDEYIINSSAFSAKNAGSGGGNPWHDEKGLFTNGPSSLSAYAPDKAVKTAFNNKDLKAFVGADGNKIKTSLQTKQLDALKKIAVACEKISSLNFEHYHGPHNKFNSSLHNCGECLTIASIRKIRNSSERYYDVTGNPHVGHFKQAEAHYRRADKILQKVLKTSTGETKEHQEYQKQLKALGTAINTFKYIENNTPKGTTNIKAALHEEKFN